MSVRSPRRHRPRVLPEDGFLSSMIDPIDRLSEVIFSVLILLTFTLAFRIFKFFGYSEDLSASMNVGEFLLAALGAIIAWGAIDGVMYALFALFERGESHRLLINIQNAESEEEALEVIAEDLDYILEPITGEPERQALYQGVLAHLKDSQPRQYGFKREDFTAAFAHVIVAVLAVIPSLAPFVFLPNQFDLAVRLSNIISFIVLFLAGYHWGKYTGANPWKTGLLLLSVAGVIVLIAIPLGG